MDVKSLLKSDLGTFDECFHSTIQLLIILKFRNGVTLLISNITIISFSVYIKKVYKRAIAINMAASVEIKQCNIVVITAFMVRHNDYNELIPIR